MGCFSFICKKSKKAVLSSSFDGDPVHLFLLKDGKVIEKMHGNYDSYGRVFDGKGDSFEWKMDWGKVCDLMFSDDETNGIAAILDTYWKEGEPYPTTRSEDDPNQGWGHHGELLSSTYIGNKVKNPTHQTFY